MASSPQFFKIVLQTSLELGKLMIPRKFVSRYGEALSSPVLFLRLPNDVEWKVELTTSDGSVWLHRGWHEFAEYASLEHGSLLVFRYNGNSRFCVTIFDKTGLEIEYPCCHGSRKFEAGRESQDDVSVEILDNSSRQYQKTRATAYQKEDKTPQRESKCEVGGDFQNHDSMEVAHDLPHQGQKRKSAGIHPPNSMGKDYSRQFDMEDEIPQQCQQSRKHGCFSSPKKKKKEDPGLKLEEGRRPSSALENADEASESSEDRTFKVVMHQSYLHSRYSMNIPVAFARRHFPKRSRTITLQTSDDKIWPLEFRWSRFGDYAYISSGWKKFAQDNGLKYRDVGIFKLIGEDKLFFVKGENSSQEKVADETKERNYVKAKVELRTARPWRNCKHSVAREGNFAGMSQIKEENVEWKEPPIYH